MADQIMCNYDVSLPPKPALEELLDVDFGAGKLFWRHRPPSMFKSDYDYRSWNTRMAGKPALNTMNHGYFVGRIFNKMAVSHRVIWKMYAGNEPPEIDHINGIKSDNRLANLRGVDRIENSRNLPISKANTSGVTGVCRFKDKWRAYIKLEYRHIHLGIFDSLDEATSCRRKAEASIGFHKNHGGRRAEI